jgi:lipopolysaccharide biosynthesis glycosyltransferase
MFKKKINSIQNNFNRGVDELKVINIAFGFDRNYYRQAVVAISSLLWVAKKNSSKIFYHFYLLVNKDVTPGIQKEIIRHLNSQYSYLDIEFKVMDDKFDDMYECRGISKAAYYRLMLHRILPDTQQIIYSDVDVIFNTDLFEFTNYNMSEFYYSGVKDVWCNLQKNRDDFKKLWSYWDNELKDIGNNYRFSGFLILNLEKIRNANIDEKIIELAKKQYNFQDQDVLNILSVNQQEHIGTLSTIYVTLASGKMLYKQALEEGIISKKEYDDVMTAPAIMHYAGVKPWNVQCENEDIWWNFVKAQQLYYKYFFFLKFKQAARKKLERFLRKVKYKNGKKETRYLGGVIKKVKAEKSKKIYLFGVQIFNKKC